MQGMGSHLWSFPYNYVGRERYVFPPASSSRGPPGRIAVRIGVISKKEGYWSALVTLKAIVDHAVEKAKAGA